MKRINDSSGNSTNSASDSGYRGEVLKVLNKAGAAVGDLVKITTKGGTVFEGVVMPRPGISTDEMHIVVKQKSGYNVGIDAKQGVSIAVLKKGSAKAGGSQLGAMTATPRRVVKGLPAVSFLSTGGTIASKVDYKTGAVSPALSAQDLYDVVPELGNVANIRAEILCNILSENMSPERWSMIADAVGKRVLEGGLDGVVIAHGTDTMHYTSAALSFALRGLPIPVVLVGSQRSSDRPSSDAAMNLTNAVTAAGKGPFAEVVVCMHGEMGDSYSLCHRGTKVRKMHTSRRDTFVSINAKPIARVEEGNVKMLVSEYAPRDLKRELRVENKFDEKVGLVKTYPGMMSDLVDAFVDKRYHGIVLEGTGLGHVPEAIYGSIKRAAEEDVVIVMTSQCISGRVIMNVYRTGRELLAMGVIPGEDMLPETALVKLMWLLGKGESHDKIRELIRVNFTGEITSVSSVESSIPEAIE
nr:Glu-tRNA(Gln) amidotransferase subunit GatD [Candidatus Njordarchaeota archaeon]